MRNPNSLKNLEKRVKFSSEHQPSPEVRSQCKINLAKEKNIIKTLRTRIGETNLLEDLVKGVASETENGEFRNALKLLEIVKEPESNTTVNINQAVQVNKKDIDEAVNIINELR